MRVVTCAVVVLVLVLVAGCANYAAVGISGSVENCYMDPGPEVAVGWDLGRFDLNMSGTRRSMATYAGGVWSEMAHVQYRVEASKRVPIKGQLWVAPFAGLTWAGWDQTTAPPKSDYGRYWGLALGVDHNGQDGPSTEIGVRRELLTTYNLVMQWFVHTGMSF